MLKINLGSGKDIRSDFINYDLIPQDESVQELDFENDTFPHLDSSIDYIQALDVLEHIHNLTHLLNECHRILKPEGIFYIEVPRFPHDDSVKDPTHVRFFIPETFKYFSDYTEACEMYGIKPWKRLIQEDLEHRIRVKMSPIK